MSGYAGVGVRQVYFAPNNTWANRTVTAYVERTNANLSTYNWIGVYSGTQPGYAVTWSTSGTAAGGEFVVTVKGTGATPQLELRCAVGNVQIAGSAVTYLAAGSSGTRQQTVTVPNNPATNPTRTVQIQWRHSGVTDWATIATYNQPPGSYVLSSGRIVAKNVVVLSNGNWAELMGISTHYNTNYFYSTYGSDMTNRYYTPTQNTGCAAYSETSTDFGKWRVPTAAEWPEIFKLYGIGTYGNWGWYLSDEGGSHSAYYGYRAGVNGHPELKYYDWGDPYKARCVRNP